MFVIDNEIMEKIGEAAKRARTKMIPWSVLQHYITKPDEHGNVQRDSKEVANSNPEVVEIPQGYLLNLTCEEQPAGVCMHVSMSTPTPTETTPSYDKMAIVIGIVAGACDTSRNVKDLQLHTWIEEYREGGVFVGRAANAIMLLEPAKPPTEKSQIN